MKAKIRPSARHILTIGEELISDKIAAILELVKNCYDADALICNIVIEQDNDSICIKIQDDGIGMSIDDILTKWLVPSTDNKLREKYSSKRRVVQGRKGIGRYSAFILGNNVEIDTKKIDSEACLVKMDKDIFLNCTYLDEIDVDVSQISNFDLQHGTHFIISSNFEDRYSWSRYDYDKLKSSLMRLFSPQILENDCFDIYLSINDGINIIDTKEKIESFDIHELYDYRIFGKISSEGRLEYTLSSPKIADSNEHNISIIDPTNCGNLSFDIRVFDRDKESLVEISKRGLYADSEKTTYLPPKDVRALLDQFNGISVYRNGFRIRPLGDPGYDWLKMNEARINSPSMRVGLNQTIGMIEIESEELSGLEEKSARDGLKDNKQYNCLVTVVKNILAKLEIYRYGLRKKLGLVKKKAKIEQQIDELFDLNDLQDKVNNSLNQMDINSEKKDQIMAIISEEFEEKQSKANELRKSIAVYEGQATLGKMINVVLHEGRRAILYINDNQSHYDYDLKKYKEKREKNENVDSYLLIFDDYIEKYRSNSRILSNLFSKIDPLAARKQSKKTDVLLSKCAKAAIDFFKNDIEKNKIDITINDDNRITMEAYDIDIYSIFINVIENSIYWLNTCEKSKKINITISYVGNKKCIKIEDSGPGFDEKLLEDNLLFDPEISGKGNGTGLGLAICGECARRNGMEISAYNSGDGAVIELIEI